MKIQKIPANKTKPIIMQQPVEHIKKCELRNRINKTVGDSDSRQGVISDAMQLLYIHVSKMTVSINKAKTLEEVKAAFNDFLPLATAIHTAHTNGQLKTVYETKGLNDSQLVNELINNTNLVTEVFVKNKPV